jgi:hypothetical protein
VDEDLRTHYRNVPTQAVEKRFHCFFDWLDTGDAWGWELVNYLQSKIANSDRWRGEVPKRHEKEAQEVLALGPQEVEALVVNWVGKEEIERSLRHW